MIYDFYQTIACMFAIPEPIFITCFLRLLSNFLNDFHSCEPRTTFTKSQAFQTNISFSNIFLSIYEKRFIKQHKMLDNYNLRLLSCVFLLFFRSNIIYVKHSKRFVHLYVDEQTFCVIYSLKILHLTCMLILSPRQGFEIANTQLVR